jgi:hypothetical protein
MSMALHPVVLRAATTGRGASMPPMHEHVHERAGQQQEVRQDPEQVRGVLGREKEPRDCEESEQDKPPGRLPPPGASPLVRHCQRLATAL